MHFTKSRFDLQPISNKQKFILGLIWDLHCITRVESLDQVDVKVDQASIDVDQTTLHVNEVAIEV